MPTTVAEIREVALGLPRAYEAWVRDRRKFRVGRLVFASLSPDETLMGFGFPKEERESLVRSDPVKFLLPVPSDERYNWVRARLAELDHDEMRELVTDAWAMCVPKRVAAEYLRDSERGHRTPSSQSRWSGANPPDRG